jgi:hypothetical protein
MTTPLRRAGIPSGAVHTSEASKEDWKTQFWKGKKRKKKLLRDHLLRAIGKVPIDLLVTRRRERGNIA